MADGVVRRGSQYYFRRRVPAHMKKYDSRREIWISLGTSNAAEAHNLAVIHDSTLEEYWRGLARTGQTLDMQDYHNAVALARAHGFAYKGAEAIATLPISEILDRINAVTSSRVAGHKLVAPILGGVATPEVLLSHCWAIYEEITGDRRMGKSSQQIKKWINPRKAALQNFIDQVGDKQLATVTRADAMAFRSWWMGRVVSKERNADTANDQFKNVRDILQSVSDARDLGINFRMVFEKISFRQRETPRPPFSPAFIQNRLCDTAVFSGLNRHATCLFYATMDTGARPAELIMLRPGIDIILDDGIPRIKIQPYDGNLLKTAQSAREIPLVGAALRAFELCPEGFSRYADNPDSATVLINKYLTNNGLRETPAHSLYSLRHSFRDRLRATGAPDEMARELMGHKGTDPKYGEGYPLVDKHKALLKIASSTNL